MATAQVELAMLDVADGPIRGPRRVDGQEQLPGQGRGGQSGRGVDDVADRREVLGERPAEPVVPT